MVLRKLLMALFSLDTPRDIILDEADIKGDCKVRLIQEVKRSNPDNYRLEVYDSKGNLRTNFKSLSLNDGTKILHEDGRFYEVREGKGGFDYKNK